MKAREPRTCFHCLRPLPPALRASRMLFTLSGLGVGLLIALPLLAILIAEHGNQEVQIWVLIALLLSAPFIISLALSTVLLLLLALVFRLTERNAILTCPCGQVHTKYPR